MTKADTYRKSLIAVAALLIATATGCSESKETKSDKVADTEQTETAPADIRGQWYIENIVFSDSDYVRPDETSSSRKQYIVFEDSTYFIMTNCNSFNGSYTVKGDSIKLADGIMTEMACDDMRTEDALRRILPGISTIDVQNDSVVRLNGSAPAECILLRKAKTEIK
ncbi:MAG: META domain-containing protein [Muribaculaceae bacterium]|nr:META domain-containing protein [Muribaculaceae bacterium]